jgi:4-hydroxybenzoate polyprenyltransferase
LSNTLPDRPVEAGITPVAVPPVEAPAPTPERPAAPSRSPFSLLKAAIKVMRPKQWIKNGLLGAALLFSGQWDALSIGAVALAFAAFSLLSSSGYVLNDYLDREADKKHPKKKTRPIASGALPEGLALVVMVTIALAGAGIALWLGPGFFVVAMAYMATTLSYSFYFKHVVILDVMFLGACYVWRAIAGAVAIHVEVSSWLFLCTAFGALFLGFSKRRAELVLIGVQGGTRKNLADYSPQMLDQFQSIVTAGTVLSYALYTALGHGQWMMLTMPHVLYGIFRYIYLVDQRGEGGAPDETFVKDRPILITVVLYVLTAGAVLYAEKVGLIAGPPTP